MNLSSIPVMVTFCPVIFLVSPPCIVVPPAVTVALKSLIGEERGASGARA